MTARRPSLWRILGRLSAAGLLTPGALAAFAVTAIGGGVNLASLLRFAARRRGGATALNDAGELTSFNDLAAQCERMAAGLRDAHGIILDRRVRFHFRKDSDKDLAGGVPFELLQRLVQPRRHGGGNHAGIIIKITRGPRGDDLGGQSRPAKNADEQHAENGPPDPAIREPQRCKKARRFHRSNFDDQRASAAGF